MAVRYSKIFPMFYHNFNGQGQYSDSGASGDYSDGIHRALDVNQSVVNHIAPSWFSNVRKVTFVWTGQWKQGLPARTVDMRLAVMPMATSVAGGNIAAVSIPLGPTQVLANTTVYNGNGTIWPFFGESVVNVNYPDAWVYEGLGGSPKLGPLTTINGGDLVAPDITEGDCQVMTSEFDRFDPEAEAFFADWDAIANAGDDNSFVGYTGVPSYVISTLTAGTLTGTLLCTGFHIIVTQAPGPVNNTCTMIPGGSLGVQSTVSNVVGRRTAFAAFPNIAASRFFYRANDWDNITEISSVFAGPDTGIITSGQSVFYQLNELPDDPAGTATVIDSFDFDGTSGSAFKDYYRSMDLLSLLEDGKKYGWDMRMEGSGGNAAGISPQSFYVVQKATTKTTFFIEAANNFTNDGMGLPGPDKVAGRGWMNYFDPLFFEDLADSLILARRQYGSLRHVIEGDLTQMSITHDAVLDARDDTPDSSVTALTMPQEFNTSGLDDGENPQISFQDFPVTDNDPFTIAGIRKVYAKTTAATVTTGDGTRFAILVYVHTVPLTETPELGPLFPIGAFNPEGCASTSAGLGDHPGLLVITNGSTIPKHFNPQAGVIEDNGIPVPFCDEIPSYTVDDIGASPDRGLGLGTYKYRYTLRNCCTLKESDPSPDILTVDTTGASPAAEVTLSFAGVRIPGDEQICEICVYRSVLDPKDDSVMAKVGCFDPDDTTLFVDDVSDIALDFTNDGLAIGLNSPMPCVPVVAEFRNRLFGMGDIPLLSPVGTVSVTNGSDIVLGSEDVEWDRCLEGKFIQVEGDCRSYEILKVLPPVAGLSPPIQRLKLTDLYESEDDTGLNYIICGRPNRLYISEPLEPECWPNANFLDVEPGDGDQLMGAVSNYDSLVICKRRKSYIVRFREQPATEIVVPTRISSDIGCIGPRTFAQIESGSVWLSDRGVVIFDGRSVQHVPESDQMNNMFIDPDNPLYVRRDSNGRVLGAVGVFYPKREQYLLLLPTVQTERGANIMLVWDIKLKNITLLEFCQEFLSMVVAKDSDGNERVYLGDTNGFVWIYDIGDSDGVGVPNAVGTVQGTVSSSGVDADTGASFLEDSSATFIEGGLPGLAGLSGTPGLSGAVDGDELGLAGACVFTRAAGAGLDTPWTVRTVFAATPTRIYVTPGWTTADQPAVGDDYMIGAIKFEALFKPSNYGTDDFLKRDWRQVVTHLPEAISSKLRIELLPDLMNSDPEELTVLNPETGEAGEGRIFDMSFNKGRQVHPVGRLIHNYQAVRMKNFAPEQPIRILNHSLMITPRQSK